MDELLTAKDLAKVLGIGVGTIYLRRFKKLPLPPAIKLGKLLRFRRADVENWLTAHIQKKH